MSHRASVQDLPVLSKLPHCLHEVEASVGRDEGGRDTGLTDLNLTGCLGCGMRCQNHRMTSLRHQGLETHLETLQREVPYPRFQVPYVKGTELRDQVRKLGMSNHGCLFPPMGAG